MLLRLLLFHLIARNNEADVLRFDVVVHKALLAQEEHHLYRMCKDILEVIGRVFEVLAPLLLVEIVERAQSWREVQAQLQFIALLERYSVLAESALAYSSLHLRVRALLLRVPDLTLHRGVE